jgi:2,3-bisphosphoglycerate-dependent phosphoglycerate mutase
VFLVRHGQAAVPDQEGRYFSKTPVPLTQAGERQAAQAGELLRKAGAEIIWASDLLRARQTAEIISSIVGAPVTYDPGLREVDSGHLDGFRLEELEREHPTFLPWVASGFRQGFAEASGYLKARTAFPGGESVFNAATRAIPVFQRISASSLGRCAAVISHAWVTSAILCHVLRIPVDHYYQFGLANAGVSLVRVQADGRGMLDALNLSVPLEALAGGALPLRQPASHDESSQSGW